MAMLGNIIWLVFGGLLASIKWFLVGLLFSFTIIGIPIGKQFFKMASLMITPYGKEVKSNVEKHLILNIIWVIFLGWGISLVYLIFAGLSALTIIGIPFAFQWIKLTKLALFPFGAEVRQIK